jgi:hypothetical protein
MRYARVGQVLLTVLASCASTPGATPVSPTVASPSAAAGPPPASAASAVAIAVPPAVTAASVTTPPPPAAPSTDSSAASAAAAASNGPTFFGAIDVGGKGIKAFVFKLVQASDCSPPGTSGSVPLPCVYGEPIFSSEAVTTLTSSAIGKKFSAQGIDDAATATAMLLDKMKEAATQKAVSPNYFIAASSGVAEFENKDDLKAAVEAKTKMPLNFVDAAAEAEGGLLSFAPHDPEILDTAFSVDIGSTNTKVGCMISRTFGAAELPYGTVTLRQAVPPATDYKAALRTFLKGTVEPEYVADQNKIPCIQSRPIAYFIGGASWAAATFTHPEMATCSFVPLTLRELDDFIHRIENGTWRRDPHDVRQTCPTDGHNADPSRADRRRVMDRYSENDLLAGISILRLILAKSNPDAKAYFARKGNYIYGWAIKHYKDARFDSGHQK